MNLTIPNSVGKTLARLSEPAKSRITAALEKLTHMPPLGDIKPLSGQRGSYRVRVGNYRIIFRLANNEVVIDKIGLRGQVYQRRN
jgi:mRNA interferase RelE/StbE